MAAGNHDQPEELLYVGVLISEKGRPGPQDIFTESVGGIKSGNSKEWTGTALIALADTSLNRQRIPEAR